MVTLPIFVIGILLTGFLFTIYILILSFFIHNGKFIKRMFKTLFFIILHVRIVPCFASVVHFGYKPRILNTIDNKNKDKKQLILLKIRVKYTIKYVVYNNKTQKLYMI